MKIPAILVVSSAIMLAACSRVPSTESKLVGTWRTSGGASKQLICSSDGTFRIGSLVAHPDGKGSHFKDDGSGKWTVKDDKLLLTSIGNNQVFGAVDGKTAFTFVWKILQSDDSLLVVETDAASGSPMIYTFLRAKDI